MSRAVVAHDSFTVRMDARDVLEGIGFEATACATAEEVRAALAAQPSPTLLVVGKRLPDADEGQMQTLAREASDRRGCFVVAVGVASDWVAAQPIGRVCVLPGYDGGQLAAIAASVAGDSLAAGTDHPRVLVVDDSPTFRHELAARLRDEGFDVVTAASGHEALRELAAAAIDCVLMDMEMPGLRGDETCARIRATPALRTIPVVMLTAQEGTTALVQALHAGADDFVAKSGDVTVLEARIRAHLRRVRHEEENRRIREELLQARSETEKASAARELAEEAARVREEFLQVASHELRTPLATLRLNVERVRRHIDRKKDVERLPQVFAGIVSQTDRLTALVENLLDVSRIDSGQLALDRRQVELCSVVADTVERFAETARAEGCELRVSCPPSLRGCWDPLRVEQVLTNLVANAIRYGRGKPIELVVTADSDVATIAVTDHGIGIAREHLERIFGRFERAAPARHYGGLGLGLYIARYIVKAHGGRMSATSQPNEATTFTVELPIRAP